VRIARRTPTRKGNHQRGLSPIKLYLTAGACSLADHIALHEAGLEVDHVRVDLRTGRTEDGGDFNEVNPKGYVPALVLDDGQLLTENVAILYWIAEQAPRLAPGGNLGRTRLIEMLAFIGSELHKPFVRSLFPTSDAERQVAEDAIRKRLGFLAARLQGDYLFGNEVSVADAYLYVMLRWAEMQSIEVPEPLSAFARRMEARPAVRQALKHEGLA
jgi:glutathione S-transferase